MQKQNKNQLNRFIIIKNGEQITEVPSMRGAARYIGCSFQHMYYEMEDNQFKYKKNVYTIIDKLASIQ